MQKRHKPGPNRMTSFALPPYQSWSLRGCWLKGNDFNGSPSRPHKCLYVRLNQWNYISGYLGCQVRKNQSYLFGNTCSFYVQMNFRLDQPYVMSCNGNNPSSSSRLRRYILSLCFCWPPVELATSDSGLSEPCFINHSYKAPLRCRFWIYGNVIIVFGVVILVPRVCLSVL